MGFLAKMVADAKRDPALGECYGGYPGSTSLLSYTDSSDVQDVLDAYAKVKRRLAKLSERVSELKPEDRRFFTSSMVDYASALNEIANMAGSNVWQTTDKRATPDARIMALETRLSSLAEDFPRYVLGFLGDGAAEAVETVAAGYGLLSEKVYKLVTKNPSAAKRMAKHLSIGATKVAFMKVWDAFQKDNPESSLDDFKIALLVMADTLGTPPAAEDVAS